MERVHLSIGCVLIRGVFCAAVLVLDKWLKFKCVKKDQVSHNVVKLRFALPTPTSVLGLPIGQHISCM
jgi:cytochrome-b5 reductase